jgi:hypothetical protein
VKVFKAQVLGKLASAAVTTVRTVVAKADALSVRYEALTVQVDEANAKLVAAQQQAQADKSSRQAASRAKEQAAISSAQAGLAKSIGAVDKALASANTDYVDLLAVDQAGAQTLPGGNATGANSETGHYRYAIAGTK